ncbi:MAG: OB-fold domain-containing protein [Sphingomonadaceae bacterium]
MDTADTIEAPEAIWRAALAEGRFLLQRDGATGEAIFPPRLDFDGAGALEWFEASGKGTVHAVTVVSQRPPAEPYNVVLVDLEEGPRMMSAVEGIAAGDVRIGMAVTARIAEGEDGPKLVFQPA